MLPQVCSRDGRGQHERCLGIEPYRAQQRGEPRRNSTSSSAISTLSWGGEEVDDDRALNQPCKRKGCLLRIRNRDRFYGARILCASQALVKTISVSSLGNSSRRKVRTSNPWYKSWSSRNLRPPASPSS